MEVLKGFDPLNQQIFYLFLIPDMCHITHIKLLKSMKLIKMLGSLRRRKRGGKVIATVEKRKKEKLAEPSHSNKKHIKYVQNSAIKPE